MIPIASGVRIWIATSHTDMRKGMRGWALLVHEGLGRDPFVGDVYVFRSRGSSLIKALWHDGIGLSLYAKRLDRGRFVWPQMVDGVGGANGSTEGLSARSNCLAEPAANVAPASGWVLPCRSPIGGPSCDRLGSAVSIAGKLVRRAALRRGAAAQLGRPEGALDVINARRNSHGEAP
jgi:transposase